MRTNFEPLSIVDETKIVALLARGDTREAIIAQFPERSLDPRTVTNVKKRNKDNLAILKEAMLQKAQDDAMAIKHKANRKLSKKLDDDDKRLEALSVAHQDFIDGNLTSKEYSLILKSNRELSVTELVSVSKEMHNQSKEDEVAPTPAKDMAALVDAIKSGDEVKLNQIIFNSSK